MSDFAAGILVILLFVDFVMSVLKYFKPTTKKEKVNTETEFPDPNGKVVPGLAICATNESIKGLLEEKKGV